MQKSNENECKLQKIHRRMRAILLKHLHLQGGEIQLSIQLERGSGVVTRKSLQWSVSTYVFVFNTYIKVNSFMKINIYTSDM